MVYKGRWSPWENCQKPQNKGISSKLRKRSSIFKIELLFYTFTTIYSFLLLLYTFFRIRNHPRKVRKHSLVATILSAIVTNQPSICIGGIGYSGNMCFLIASFWFSLRTKYNSLFFTAAGPWEKACILVIRFIPLEFLIFFEYSLFLSLQLYPKKSCKRAAITADYIIFLFILKIKHKTKTI